MPNFDKYTNYSESAGVTSVVIGADSPVLEVELNEMQEIQKSFLRKTLKNIIGDGISDKTAISYFNGTLSIASGCYFSVGGYLIQCTGLSIALTEGTVYLQVWEETVDSTATLKTEGNQQSASTVPNYFKDTRYPIETSKRKVVKYTLSTAMDSLKQNLAIATVSEGTILTTTLVKEVNLTKLGDRVSDLQRFTNKVNTSAAESWEDITTVDGVVKKRVLLFVEDILSTGRQINFKAPFDSSEIVEFTINGESYDIVDMKGDSVLETSIWAENAMVSMILNTGNHKAYVQNLQSVPCDVLLANDPYRDEDGTIISNIKPLDYSARIIKLSNFDRTRFNTNPRKFNRYCDFTNSSWSYALCFTEDCVVDIDGHIGLIFVISLDTCPELTLEYVVNNYKNLFSFRSIEDDTVYSYPEEFEVEETEGETEEGDLVKYLVGSFIIRHSLQVQKVNVGVANLMNPNFAEVINNGWYAGNIQFLLNYSSKVRLKIY